MKYDVSDKLGIWLVYLTCVKSDWEREYIRKPADEPKVAYDLSSDD